MAVAQKLYTDFTYAPLSGPDLKYLSTQVNKRVSTPPGKIIELSLIQDFTRDVYVLSAVLCNIKRTSWPGPNDKAPLLRMDVPDDVEPLNKEFIDHFILMSSAVSALEQ